MPWKIYSSSSLAAVPLATPLAALASVTSRLRSATHFVHGRNVPEQDAKLRCAENKGTKAALTEIIDNRASAHAPGDANFSIEVVEIKPLQDAIDTVLEQCGDNRLIEKRSPSLPKVASSTATIKQLRYTANLPSYPANPDYLLVNVEKGTQQIPCTVLQVNDAVRPAPKPRAPTVVKYSNSSASGFRRGTCLEVNSQYYMKNNQKCDGLVPSSQGSEIQIKRKKQQNSLETNGITNRRRAAAAGKLTSKRERPFEEKSRLFLNGIEATSFDEWGVGFTCRKGMKKSHINQDDFFVYCCSEWGLYGVFDGHGPGGHFVSNFVQWHLPNVISDQINIQQGVASALAGAFLCVHKMVKEASEKQNFDCASSGSTASVVLHRRLEKKLFIAHVGDSKVVMARRNQDGKLVAECLTKDHKPENPLERQRIEMSGGEVRRPVGHIPHRVFIKGRNFPGLAMSRSIGDCLGQSAGVTSEPDILERDVIEGVDEYLILCSDGVWEFIDEQEAVDIVSRFSIEEAAQAVEALSIEAWKRWLERDGHLVDDITAQVVYMFPFKKYVEPLGKIDQSACEDS